LCHDELRENSACRSKSGIWLGLLVKSSPAGGNLKIEDSMTVGDDAVRALRAALEVSPDNVPLRQHLATTLAGLGRYGDAEAEYRRALALAPDHLALKLGLAKAFYQQGKNSHALVIAEDLIKGPDASAETFVFYARLLSAAGDDRRAASMYRRGIEADTAVADAELAERLGVEVESHAHDEQGVDDDGRQRAAWDGPGDGAEVAMERPKIGFADIGGMESIKEEIRLKIIYPLTHAKLYQAYGKAIGGGILLYGPPGCGKTHLARATAGEIRAKFLAIGINDVLDMWIGNSEKNLHALFEQARANAPCVLFFDEVDALGASRSDLRQSGARQLVNQFLAELDGMQASNDGLLILAATNAPWQLDSAFRRPGRFDRIVFVPPPDEVARAEILRILCQNKPVDRLDFSHLAKKTQDYSGADLKAVLDRAIEAKLRQALLNGIPQPLTTKDLLAVTKDVKPSTKDWFATARNHALYANQSGLYDDILKYLKIT
jgi:AAA+ superfamily predicted ATPase